jgi:hypothetical protein
LGVKGKVEGWNRRRWVFPWGDPQRPDDAISGFWKLETGGTCLDSAMDAGETVIRTDKVRDRDVLIFG